MLLVGSESERLETWMCLETNTGLEDGIKRQSKGCLLPIREPALTWLLEVVDGVLQSLHLSICIASKCTIGTVRY